MAQYDGSIRINTRIKIKEAEAQLTTLENRMKKTADRITSLRSKMDALKDAKISTQEYKDISEQIAKASAEFDRLLEKQEQMQRSGKDHGASWDELNRKMDEVGNTIKYASGELKDLVDTGKAFTFGSDTEDYANLSKQLQYAENEMSVLNQRHDVLEMKQKKVGKGYRELAGKAKSAFNAIGNVLKKTNSTVNAFARKIRDTAQRHLPFFRKETEKVKSSLSGFKDRLKSLTMSLLLFNQISKAFRALSSSVSAGFVNMYNDDERFRASIDDLKASVLTLQNAFAAAFRPIVDTAVPYIQKLVEWLAAAVNLAGQFFAALTGRKTYTRAIKQTAAASEEAAEAAEEETEAINKQLSPLDDLNNLTSENNKEKNKGKDDKDIGSGTGIMFEEVPIDSGILDMADKVRDILSKLFAPMKEAWDREGKFVIDSWKYGLNEVWKLIKDIGRDFLTVWQQEKTIKIFEDLLHIIGDIGLVIGHLARNFREAWNENETGLRILENIRDIIGVIVHNFRLAADETVKWADKLNFKPLLEAFERFTKSLIPLADALSGILADFYTEVLLPLGKWTIEKGLPELLDVFTAFNEKVDWEALRENLAEFWRHLEPFAETVGEGLIIFIERVSDALADFLNSQEFKDFLVTIEDWMDKVTPEDVADVLEKIAKALIVLKLAVLGFGAISAVTGVFTTLATFFSAIGSFGSLVVKGASLVATGIGNIIAACGGLLPILAVVAAAVAGWKIGEWINEKLLGVDTPSFFEMMDGIKSSFEDGSWKEALKLWGDDIYDAFVTIGEREEEKFNEIKQDIAEKWESIKIDTTAKWDEIKGNLSEKWESIKVDTSTKFGNIKANIIDVWNDIKSKTSEKWESIKSTIKNAIDWISSKIKSLKSSFNLGSGFGSRNIGSGGASRIATASTYSANPAFAALATAPIPKLATGTVIPPNREFLAVLGDQKRGNNIEAPEDLIRQIVREETAKNNNTGGGDVNLHLTVECEGYKLLELMKKLDREYFKQTGKHALA